MYQPENTCQMEFGSSHWEPLEGIENLVKQKRKEACIEQRMSDGSIEKQQSQKVAPNKETSSDSAPSAAGSKSRPLFGRLNSDLKEALDTWDTLTEQMATKLSPEEEQLQEVKRLLSELKSKLNEFED